MVGVAGIATMLFYNQVLGVSASLCGTAFLIGSIVDAISDPLVGAVSDGLQTRWGRRHPFMLFSALPLGLSLYLLYQPPAGLSETSLFLWMTGTTILLRLSRTFYAVPHSALGAELTDDYDERTSIWAYNWVVSSLGGVALGVFVLVVIFPSTEGYDNGLLNPDRYAFLALFSSCFAFLMILLCTWSTRDQIPYLHQATQERVTTRLYLENLLSLLRNRSYLAVCLSWLVVATTGGVIAVVATYTFVYAFEFTTEELTIRSFIVIPGAFVAIPLSALLTRWLDKKYTVIGALFVVAFLIGLPYALRMWGWFPENGSPWLLPTFFGIWTLAYLLLPVIPIVIDSQLVDVADEHELKTGKRSEGMIFSIRTFSIKMSQGLGGLIGGFGLDIIGFPRNARINEMEPEVINGLLFMMGPLYWIIVGSGTLFAFMYRISRARHEEIPKNARKPAVESQLNSGTERFSWVTGLFPIKEVIARYAIALDRGECLASPRVSAHDEQSRHRDCWRQGAFDMRGDRPRTAAT